MTTTTTRYRFVIPRKQTRISADAPSAAGFRAVFERLQAGDPTLASKCDIRHEGKCGRCGRALTRPESIDTGLGPECAAKMGRDWSVTGARFDALTFALAGHAIFTVTSKRTGASFTYRVAQAEGREGETSAPYFVSVLTGPDNGRDYTWLGMLFPE